MKIIQNYIDGKFQDPISQNFMDNINPATGKIYGKIPLSTNEDALLAIEAAKNAFPKWKALSTNERSNILRKIANSIRENLDELAKAESIDNGKPIQVAKSVDIPRSATNFDFFADAITQKTNHSYDMDSKALNYTLRDPLGVVTCISPWNLPLYLFTWKIAPALAYGNTVVAKPSEITPMTSYLLSKICKDIGLPDGVLNIVHGLGSDLGQTITTHKDIQAVTFTGSTATGKIIAKNTAPLFKKLSLEMGGKNPSIIFADCDFEKALNTTIRSSFANQGQICLCASRVYVEQEIYEKFKKKLLTKANSLIQGDPLEEATQQGAIVSKDHFDKIMNCIETAKKEGGKILCGGISTKVLGECENGYFIKPTIIENLESNCETNQKEIFGPVITLTPFTKEVDVLKLANNTEYGLAATIWTKDIDKAHRLASKIESGIVWINTWMLRDLRTPFGGVKNSGVGREGGEDAYRFFTKVKNVCIAIGESNE